MDQVALITIIITVRLSNVYHMHFTRGEKFLNCITVFRCCDVCWLRRFGHAAARTNWIQVCVVRSPGASRCTLARQPVFCWFSKKRLNFTNHTASRGSTRSLYDIDKWTESTLQRTVHWKLASVNHLALFRATLSPGLPVATHGLCLLQQGKSTNGDTEWLFTFFYNK